jgi:NAD(P)-dependent dehydrogenase (short-subunit alcohol dehydrogenase family)
MTHAPIALITGGGRGIGRSAALRLADRGTDVVITYRHDEAAARDVVARLEASGRRAAALSLDVAESAAFPAFVTRLRQELERRWGRATFDALVNNAGSGHHALIADTTEGDFQQQFDIHLKGTFFLTQALLPLLADGGRIVNVSTRLTTHTYPGQATYAIMKAGVETLTRYLARELGPRGIAVNALAPGGVATEFGNGLLLDPKLQAAVAADTALGRMGQPDDVGAAIVSLLSPETGWITGERIEITGGYQI